MPAPADVSIAGEGADGEWDVALTRGDSFDPVATARGRRAQLNVTVLMGMWNDSPSSRVDALDPF